jgi:hypothetical protein
MMKNLQAFYLPAFLALFVAVAIFSAWLFLGADDAMQSPSAPPSFKAVLQGVQPGTQVTYRVFGNDSGEAIKGQILSDETGRVVLPDFVYADAPPPLLTYDLSLQPADAGAARDVVVSFNGADGKAKIMSRGLAAFSDIKLETPHRITTAKADWAGIYRDIESSGFDMSQNNNQAESFKLALFDGPIQRDVMEQSPLVIEVINAPGGGGPTSAGVNQYTTFNCGTPPRSACRSSFSSQFINNIVNNYVKALQLMTEQLSAVMMNYVFGIGAFMDAKMQLETQRELQTLQAEAHKDYHPSEVMCEFGSFVKTVARTEEKAKLDKAAMGAILMANYTGAEHVSTSDGFGFDAESRIKQFREVYCDPADNNNGLRHMCQHNPADGAVTDGELVGGGAQGSENPGRLNKDIDFARSVYRPMTLDVNFTDAVKTQDEEDLLAMSRNLYWPRALAIANPDSLINLFPAYQNARSLFAKQSVAHNSFLEIAGMKAASEPGNAEQSGWNFMKALLQDFGLEDQEIHAYLGDHPSYYAQMEILTKKIYQNPDFYTNLYDKPANIDRIGVSIDAFQLMQTRDLYESSLRKEMLMSLLVERALAKHYDEVDSKLESVTSKLRYQ